MERRRSQRGGSIRSPSTSWSSTWIASVPDWTMPPGSTITMLSVTRRRGNTAATAAAMASAPPACVGKLALFAG
ncbi:hypothetical protein [Allokutzneria albata]|nr:hypothetical protein [Allokutzneria albata]